MAAFKQQAKGDRSRGLLAASVPIAIWLLVFLILWMAWLPEANRTPAHKRQPLPPGPGEATLAILLPQR